MSKRVFIVHGWDGYPDEGWFPWLKKELEVKGFSVTVPQLPDPETPHIKNWIPALVDAVGVADENTYFVGHSMGCQTIARYLATLPKGAKVGGAVFVAGFFKRLTNLEPEDDVQEIANEWLTSLVDLLQVKTHLPKCAAIFSTTDPYVPMDNQDDFKNKLGAEIIVKENAGHFSGNMDKVFELPEALNALLNIAS